MTDFISKYFNFQEKNTSLKTETIAGITTFLTMSYALFLIPSVLADAGMPKDSVFVATAVAAAVGTLIMGIFAKFPMALAPGVGLNAFFTYSVCIGMDIPWQTALSGVLASGIIFLIISATGLRELVIKAIPTNLKFAVSSGIGLFIAFIGLKNAGIVVANSSTFVALGDLTNPTVLLSVFGLVAISIFMVRGSQIAIFLGMALTVIVGMIFGLIDLPTSVISMPPSMAPTFGVAIKNIGNIFNPQMVLVIFTFLFMDFFDTAGTLVAVGSKVGLLKKDGSVEGGSKALLADSVATCIGSIFGTTNTTSYVESLSGVAVGAKTGFSSVVVGVLFLVSLFFSPLLTVITSAVTAPALIIVGSLMCSSLKEIEWEKSEVSISAFLTIILMPLTYSIGEGIACGFLSYVVLMMFKGKAKKVHPVMYVLAVLFIIYFAIR
ncbi:MAG: NCS2 family permease [Clostridium celatum]|uniref:Guanine/hypoxanthine permease PbuG n=1 Tax=Clostridium celatum DSM 1785 TaxID=545697 RepID=L1QLS7_9CLOT|nr:NCS2 family permease [Clostridium celatum]EKY28527.1 guanine/hypoxanthine permease PbuG [Clostridium celatum DSM 1785]MCE9654889.1 NCS2 family permease [Clostridium celatum]MDU2265321.1 NCS2 family permease [Clostridium celatum]MDU3721895.1 NCS2 family permease [Clostridium celatum]MDU6294953.1 NCS2 family permease [Clostridium celatum]